MTGRETPQVQVFHHASIVSVVFFLLCLKKFEEDRREVDGETRVENENLQEFETLKGNSVTLKEEEEANESFNQFKVI
jgi:hypothetical protein